MLLYAHTCIIAKEEEEEQQPEQQQILLWCPITTIWKHDLIRCMALCYDAVQSDAIITIEN